MIQYIIDQILPRQIQSLQKRGGQYQRAARTVAAIVGRMRMSLPNPFEGVALTKHGESRIKHCVKYDLSGYARLVTIQNDNVFTLKFVGTHDECDVWLEKNKGLNLAVDKDSKGLVDVVISEDINDENKRIADDSDYSEGLLYKKLKDHYFLKISDLVSHARMTPFLFFDSTVTQDQLIDACTQIENEDIQLLFLDVFGSLRNGDIDQARNRILQFAERLKLLTDAKNADIEDIKSNDKYLKLNDIDPDILQLIFEKSDWYEWMLFLHPDQKQIVQADYNGSARLLGVSGSGKTCVLVHRAVRLSEKYPGEKILILTLNESLSKLIENLIDILIVKTKRQHLRDQIVVCSFWELSRNYLIEFDHGQAAKRIFNPHTDKTGETIDEIWDEYYACKANNEDASVIFPVHQNLLARGIYSQDYLKQEFDWIRSALSKSERESYLTIEREGRFIPLAEEDRRLILKALKGWDEKMEFVGATDYTGIANSLYSFIDRIEPSFRCILVDEIQDFGTIELTVIRKLVPRGENDLFVCGDIAQQVYNKHHKIKYAGIQILPEGFLKILKNYRNSREILEAAHAVFSSNVDLKQLKFEDFEVLDPEFANFSSPKPFLRKADSLDQEFSFAIEYLKSAIDIDKRQKACIAFCGYTMFDISAIGKEYRISVLDGNMDLSDDNVFLSDLEQTKGFEFDRMIILNCNQDVIPNPVLPKEEWFREISKLYVAMTRAKKDLVLSYSSELSHLFENVKDFFTEDKWGDHIFTITHLHNLGINERYRSPENQHVKLIGKDMLYQKMAVGISKELQNRLIEHVAGKQVTDEKGKKIGWRNMGELRAYILSRIRDNPTLHRTFGPVGFNELESLLKKMYVSEVQTQQSYNAQKTTIIVYGNSDTRPVFGFPTEEDFKRYIENDIFYVNKGRYQYSQTKDADIIVLTRNGKAHGYFVISGVERPSLEDLKISDSCKKVYLVKESVLFAKPVLLKSLGITGYQFGKSLTQGQFEQIKGLAGKIIAHVKPLRN